MKHVIRCKSRVNVRCSIWISDLLFSPHPLWLRCIGCESLLIPVIPPNPLLIKLCDLQIVKSEIQAELLTVYSQPVSMCQVGKRMFLLQGKRIVMKVLSVSCDIIAFNPLMTFSFV